jgi:hypothetical protein
VRYREALAALDQYCKNEKGGAFASLSDADKGAIIGALESGAAKLDGVDGQAFFELLLRNVRGDFSPIRFMAAIAICAPESPLGSSAPHAPDELERRAPRQLASVKPQAPGRPDGLGLANPAHRLQSRRTPSTCSHKDGAAQGNGTARQGRSASFDLSVCSCRGLSDVHGSSPLHTEDIATTIGVICVPAGSARSSKIEKWVRSGIVSMLVLFPAIACAAE